MSGRYHFLNSPRINCSQKWSTVNKQVITSTGEDMEKLEDVYIAGENVKMVQLQDSLAVPQKVIYIITI